MKGRVLPVPTHRLVAVLIDNPKDYVFSSLTASVDGEVKFVPFSNDAIGRKLGTLQLPMDAKILINDGQDGVATLGSLTDLLGVCELVADLMVRHSGVGGQAAGMSSCKEDSHAACPTQFDTRPDPCLDRRRRFGRGSCSSAPRAAPIPRWGGGWGYRGRQCANGGFGSSVTESLSTRTGSVTWCFRETLLIALRF